MKRWVPFVPLALLLGLVALRAGTPGEAPLPPSAVPQLEENANSMPGAAFKGPAGPRAAAKPAAEAERGPRPAGAAEKFAGVWETTYGPLRLTREGDEVRGFYEQGGPAAITGKVEGGRLVFRYQEVAARGEGWFEVSPDGGRLTGKWRAEGAAEWGDWVGRRVVGRPGVVWLVVLEAYWEGGLAEQEYAFGQMLRSFFARSDQIAVRHRYFHDADTLARHLRDLAYLPGPVVLSIATHADAGGLTVGGRSIGPETLVEALRYTENLRLLHFSACLTMEGDFARSVLRGLGKRGRFPVSGYASCVDWAASAVIEFTYLDMILMRGMSPEEAAGQVARLMPFAGDDPIPGSAIEPARFRLLIPRAAE